MPSPSSWDIASSLGAVAAAGFAGLQIWYSRRDANRRAVFEHLREIDKRLQHAWLATTKTAQTELLAYYGGHRPDLSQAARHYLGLLDSIDLLCFAMKYRLVDRHIALKYAPTLLNSKVVSVEFVQQLQQCCGDTRVYEHLVAYLSDPKRTNSH